jgi:hypothetical protein
MPYDELPRAQVIKAGVTKAFKRIQQWEDGESFPTYPQLEQLAEAFKVPVAVSQTRRCFP